MWQIIYSLVGGSGANKIDFLEEILMLKYLNFDAKEN